MNALRWVLVAIAASWHNARVRHRIARIRREWGQS